MESGKKTLRIVLSVVLVAATLVCGIYVYNYEDSKQNEARIENAKNEKEKEDEQSEKDEIEDVNSYEAESEDPEKEVDSDEQKKSEQNGEDEPLTEEPSADDVSSNAVLPELDFNEGTLLNLPVSGKTLIPYSMDRTVYFSTLDSYRCNPAVMIEAAPDTPVAVVANSQVASITDNAETGTTVTMDMGNGYQAVYGQLKDVNVEEGQTVESGTVVANVNTPTKYFTKEGSNLYFALNKDGSPLDPSLYLPPEAE